MSKSWQSPWFPAECDLQCLKAFVCPTILGAQVAEALKDGAVGKVEDQSCFNPYLCACPPLLELATFMQRGQIRKKYNMEKEPGMDFLQTCCVPWVGVLQNAEEIDRRTAPATAVELTRSGTQEFEKLQPSTDKMLRM